MSKITHDLLVQKASSWLYQKHSIVMYEAVTTTGEVPDAIGWRYGGVSTLVECKISKNDYYADNKKWFRKKPEYGMGNYRYYLTPKGLLNPENLREGWGLLELRGTRIFRVKESSSFSQINEHKEKSMFMSALRGHQASKLKIKK